MLESDKEFITGQKATQLVTVTYNLIKAIRCISHAAVINLNIPLHGALFYGRFVFPGNKFSREHFFFLQFLSKAGLNCQVTLLTNAHFSSW
jgi:hypothetical protein